jgi:hypothetical protein
MKRTTFFSICFITGILLAGCAAGTPDNTAAPANTAVPTNTPVPLNITTVDLTNVFLKTEDLPAGFHKFTDAEMKSMGVTDLMAMTTSMISSMVKPFAGVADLVKADLYGKNTKTVEFLVNVFFYPLSPSSIFQIDMGFTNPAIIGQFLKDVQILPDFSGIGNSSIGLTAIVQGYNLKLIVFRRNNTMIAFVEANQSAASVFDLKAIGQKMDQYVLAEYK